MRDKFYNIEWHDSQLLEIFIDRKTPGNADDIVLKISLPNDEINRIIFKECYYAHLNLNFGISTPDTVLDVNFENDSDELNKVIAKWQKVGSDISPLYVFKITTNTSNSNIKIFAKDLEIQLIS